MSLAGETVFDLNRRPTCSSFEDAIMQYDLIVIGRDSNGLQAALAASKLGKRVALIEHSCGEHHRREVRSQNMSTKSLREAALLLTGFRHREVSPELFARRGEVTWKQWQQLSQQISTCESDAVEQSLRQNGVELFLGRAQFVSPHDIEVIDPLGKSRRMNGDKLLIAVGTKPVRSSWIAFDNHAILDTDELSQLERIPQSMIVVGSDAISLELSMIFAILGTRVVVVGAGSQGLDCFDQEMADLLCQRAESLGVQFRFGHTTTAIERVTDNRVAVCLDDDTRLFAEAVVCSFGRHGQTESLNLDTAGLMCDEQGRLWCNDDLQTWAEHIYAVGDVVGFPTSTANVTNQGQRVIQHAFGLSDGIRQPIAHGMLTTPELAKVGATEEQLIDESVPYEIGTTHFEDLSRGHVRGSESGVLKLLFHRESLRILGVHCLSEMATDLIRIGQTVMSLHGTIESFFDVIFNDATMSDCYRLAAENGIARLKDQPTLVRTHVVSANAGSAMTRSIDRGVVPFSRRA